MSKVLIIPDVHLKPAMLDRAEEILNSGQADFAIQLGDLLDDWGEEFNLGLYERTLRRVIDFHKKFPKTLWCMGNHDYGYHHLGCGIRESGHSRFAEDVVQSLLEELHDIGGRQKIVHIVDNVIFSHAGVAMEYVRSVLPKNTEWDKDGAHILNLINDSLPEDLWKEFSPIWVRPQGKSMEMWSDMLQVVGHTPVRTAVEDNGVLSTDTFSTYPNGAPYGDERFVIIDTLTKRWKYAKEEDE